MEPIRHEPEMVRGLELLAFDNVQLEKIREDGTSTFATIGPLSVFYFDYYERFVLQLNNFRYGLIPRLPTALANHPELNAELLSLVGYDGIYNLRINNSSNPNPLLNLRTILLNATKLTENTETVITQHFDVKTIQEPGVTPFGNVVPVTTLQEVSTTTSVHAPLGGLQPSTIPITQSVYPGTITGIPGPTSHPVAAQMASNSMYQPVTTPQTLPQYTGHLTGSAPYYQDLTSHTDSVSQRRPGKFRRGLDKLTGKSKKQRTQATNPNMLNMRDFMAIKSTPEDMVPVRDFARTELETCLVSAKEIALKLERPPQTKTDNLKKKVAGITDAIKEGFSDLKEKITGQPENSGGYASGGGSGGAAKGAGLLGMIAGGLGIGGVKGALMQSALEHKIGHKLPFSIGGGSGATASGEGHSQGESGAAQGGFLQGIKEGFHGLTSNAHHGQSASTAGQTTSGTTQDKNHSVFQKTAGMTAFPVSFRAGWEAENPDAHGYPIAQPREKLHIFDQKYLDHPVQTHLVPVSQEILTTETVTTVRTTGSGSKPDTFDRVNNLLYQGLMPNHAAGVVVDKGPIYEEEVLVQGHSPMKKRELVKAALPVILGDKYKHGNVETEQVGFRDIIKAVVNEKIHNYKEAHKKTEEEGTQKPGIIDKVVGKLSCASNRTVVGDYPLASGTEVGEIIMTEGYKPTIMERLGEKFPVIRERVDQIISKKKAEAHDEPAHITLEGALPVHTQHVISSDEVIARQIEQIYVSRPIETLAPSTRTIISEQTIINNPTTITTGTMPRIHPDVLDMQRRLGGNVQVGGAPTGTIIVENSTAHYQG